MPILTIEIISHPNESFSPNLVRHLANRTGQIFASSPNCTWVKLHILPANHYAENDSNPLEPIYPIFISILKATLPSPDIMREEINQLTTAVAELCNRPPENVHIIYLPEGSGRIAFGGQIVGR